LFGIDPIHRRYAPDQPTDIDRHGVLNNIVDVGAMGSDADNASLQQMMLMQDRDESLVDLPHALFQQQQQQQQQYASNQNSPHGATSPSSFQPSPLTSPHHPTQQVSNLPLPPHVTDGGLLYSQEVPPMFGPSARTPVNQACCFNIWTFTFLCAHTVSCTFVKFHASISYPFSDASFAFNMTHQVPLTSADFMKDPPMLPPHLYDVPLNSTAKYSDPYVMPSPSGVTIHHLFNASPLARSDEVLCHMFS
jgi:hypothetical protein